MTIESYESVQAIENPAERAAHEKARNDALRERPRTLIAKLAAAPEGARITINGSPVATWREFAGGKQACPVERLGLMVRAPVERTRRVIDPSGKVPTRDVTETVPSDVEVFIGWADVQSVEVEPSA